MNNTIKQTIAGVIIAGAGFVGGATGSIDASEVTKIDASRANSVGEVLIEKTIVSPTTTVERYTVNDLVSEIEMLDRQIAGLTSRRASLVAKVQSVQAEVEAKYQAEVAKREGEAPKKAE